MKFIADVMLGKLAKRMRLLGFDVLYDRTVKDNELLRLALEQDRAILTRDTGLASRPLARNHILIQSDHVDDQLIQVLGVSTPLGKDALTRCSICNGPLSAIAKQDARDIVPDHVYAVAAGFWRCARCEKVYWKGSHVRNMTVRRATKRSGSK